MRTDIRRHVHALPTWSPTCEEHITGPRGAGGSLVTGQGQEELLEGTSLPSPPTSPWCCAWPSCVCSASPPQPPFTFCL